MTQATLYKRDTKGKIREWRMELDGNKYRTIAGLQDGEQVTSGWTTAEAKNVGRANAKTAEQQAEAEVAAQYKKKLKVDYHTSVDDIDVVKVYKPMLATSWEKRLSKINFIEGVYEQPKLDGIRCIANKDGCWSRTGKPIVAIPHIVDMLKPFFEANPDAVLDGELYNHDLKHDFNEIISIVRRAKCTPEDHAKSRKKAQYHVYDYASHEGDFIERYHALEEALVEIHNSNDAADLNEAIQLVPTSIQWSKEDLDLAYGKHMEAGYEGGMVRLNGPYEQKRSNQLIKRKDFEDAEFTIVRIEEGNGNWAGLAKRVFFTNDLDGREVGAGLKGSKDYAKHVLDNAESYIGKQVTIQFFTRTPDGVPRFPIAKQLHEDTRW